MHNPQPPFSSDYVFSLLSDNGFEVFFYFFELMNCMNSMNMNLKVREIHEYESAKCHELMNMNLPSATNA